MQTTNKEENQIAINIINENKEKRQEKDKTEAFYDYVIQPSGRRNNLIDAINLVLKNFNQIWFENIKIKESKNEQVILIGKNSQNY